MQLAKHPRLDSTITEEITFYFNGQLLKAKKGQTVAGALMANGIKKFGVSRKLSQPRGLYCANGRCYSCYVTINGMEHTLSCNTLVDQDMIVHSNDSDPIMRSEKNGN